jgi:hypothetical protein
VLELSALAPKRQKVLIRTAKSPDGELFEMASPADIGILEFERLAALFTELGEAMGREKPTVAEEKRAAQLLDQLAGRILIDAPATDVRKIGALDKMRLIDAFFVPFDREREARPASRATSAN